MRKGYWVAFVFFSLAWLSDLLHEDYGSALQNVGLMWVCIAMASETGAN